MNLRQKAKHYKKLYEDMLQKPYPVIYGTRGTTRDAKHYRVGKVVDEREIIYAQQTTPQLFKTRIENSMLEELRPVIWDNLRVKKDLDTDKIIFSLDVWM